MERVPHTRSQPFDHNTGWKSKSVAENYDERRFSSIGGRFYDRREKRAIAACLGIAGSIAPVTSILDLACGTGRISALLSSGTYQLTCADISGEMLAVARERLMSAGASDVTFLELDIYETGLPAGQFDCVCAFRLFQHLTSEQRARALHEMARISRRFVLVNVMHTSAYYGALRALRRALGRYTTRYTSTSRETGRELDYSGLRIVKSILTQPGFNGDRVLLCEKYT